MTRIRLRLVLVAIVLMTAALVQTSRINDAQIPSAESHSPPSARRGPPSTLGSALTHSPRAEAVESSLVQSNHELIQLARSIKNGEQGYQHLRSFFRQKMPIDSVTATGWIRLFEGTDSIEVALLALSAEWMIAQPENALAWIAQDALEGRRQIMRESGGAALGLSNPQKGMNLAGSIPEGWDRNEYQKAVVEGWMSHDFAGAFRYVEQMPESAGRNEALVPLLSELSQRRPSEAANFVASRLSQGPFQNEAAQNVVTNWLNQDPEAAINWVQKFPEGDLKNELSAMIFQFNQSVSQ
jgi:hypothetical protein